MCSSGLDLPVTNDDTLNGLHAEVVVSSERLDPTKMIVMEILD